jgi:type II secretory pathway pseudopilin PulG
MHFGSILSTLTTNKDQLGIILSALLLAATVTLIFVGVAQAKAANAQARVAKLQLDEITRPLLQVCKVYENLDWHDNNQIYCVKNNGHGTARDIVIEMRLPDGTWGKNEHVKTDGIVLPIGASIPLLRSKDYDFSYSSMSDKAFWASVCFSWSGPQMVIRERPIKRKQTIKGLWVSLSSLIKKASTRS